MTVRVNGWLEPGELTPAVIAAWNRWAETGAMTRTVTLRGASIEGGMLTCTLETPPLAEARVVTIVGFRP